MRAKMLHNPCILRVHNKGDKITIHCFTSAVLGAQMRAQMLHNTCILGGP